MEIDVKNNKPPEGYNPIHVIRGAMFHEICVPFNNSPVWCYVTCLNSIQIQSAGDISCLCFNDEKKSEKYDIIEVIKRKNVQENLVKLVLVKPTFDEIIGMIIDENFIISEKIKALEKIKNEIKTAQLNNSERKKLQRKIEKIEFHIGFLLPDDTMSFLTSWALGIEITDIKKLSRDILLDAAIMAANGKDNPSDHITGVFTDFQREDINKHAWYIYKEYIDDKERESKLKKSKYRWYGGKNKVNA
jgi:hypothetical protein